MGICVGLQVLFDYSEETDTQCLGLLPGQVRQFRQAQISTKREMLKIPHMGWNAVAFSGGHPVFSGVPAGSEFYFVHSFYPDPADAGLVRGVTGYGIDFASAVALKNLVAMQFHPEKSGTPGLKILQNFCAWNGAST